jgi:N-methylhydantoinase B
MSGASGFDPLALMVMSNAVSMIAEEMGVVLERGALSPNIRERRDASSALFDARGRMVAQAAHIPVHLGAMPESVRAVMAQRPSRATCSCSTIRTRADRTCLI